MEQYGDKKNTLPGTAYMVSEIPGIVNKYIKITCLRDICIVMSKAALLRARKE